MNRAVPMVAVKLSAFRMGDNLVLHPVKVLDVFEEVMESDTGEVEQVDRGYWEKKSAPASLSMVDKVLSMLQAQGIQPRVTYNRYHIAVGTTGRNFCWLRPRRTAGNCHIEFRVTAETRDSVLSSLQNAGIDATPWRSENIAFRINAKSLDEQSNLLIAALTRAEEASRL
jgi:hypothetical protein